MALTGAQKNQIAQAGLTLAISTLGGTAAAGLPLFFLPIAVGITSLFQPKFPKFPGATRADRELRELFARGLPALQSIDPFSGDVVISTRDQAPVLQQILLDRALRRSVAGQDTSDILAFRQGVVAELRRTAQERGFPTTFDPALRGGVFRPTAESPLQFIEGNFLG